MSDRDRALADIAALAREHGISPSEITAAMSGRSGTADAPVAVDAGDRRQQLIVRVLGFLGGTFVFAGIGVFMALQWDGMNSAARVVVTLGSGLALFVMAILAARDERFEKAATPLFLAAAALQPSGMLVAFDEYGSGGDWQLAIMAACGAAGLQYSAVFSAFGRSTLLFLVILFGLGFTYAGFDYLDVDGTVTAIALGIGLLAASVAADRAGRGVITPLWYLVGSVALLAGFFDAVGDSPAEILFLGLAAGLVYLSAVLHSRTLLFVATLAILSYVGWFTGQHFADSVGWPVALIGFGLFMIGLSAVAFRIDRDYVRRRGLKDRPSPDDT